MTLWDKEQLRQVVKGNKPPAEEQNDLKIKMAELTAANERLQREIETHKQAAAEMTEELNLLRTLINHMPDPIYIKDTAGRFLVANEMVGRVMGATASELIGKTDFDFYPEHHYNSGDI